MSRTAGSVRDDAGLDRRSFIWVAPVAFLLGLWLWLAFSSGGYLPRQWLLPAIVLGFFGLVVGALAAYPRRPRQLSLAVLALFGGYSVWVAVSALWAASTGRVWLESGRTFAYLLILALALVYFTAPAARTAFRYLLIAAAFVLVAVCVWRLWSTPDVAQLFVSKRLTYPASYPNNSAAMFLVSFWPLMWLASGPGERAPIRGLALGLATGLLALALMTQSRGALWSLAISLVLMFVLSPARLRLFLYLAVPALLMAYAFPRLNRYWVEGPEALGGALAARTIAVAVIMAAGDRRDPCPAGALGAGEGPSEDDNRRGGPGGVCCRAHLRRLDVDQGRRRTRRLGVADLAAVHGDGREAEHKRFGQAE